MSSKNNKTVLPPHIKKDIARYEAVALSMKFILDIEEFRIANKISKKALAQAAGVKQSYLSQIYSGDKLINITMLAGISQKYKIRFDTVFDNIESGVVKIIENTKDFVQYKPKIIELWNPNDFMPFERTANGH